jgi:hypothetical protein
MRERGDAIERERGYFRSGNIFKKPYLFIPKTSVEKQDPQTTTLLNRLKRDVPHKIRLKSMWDYRAIKVWGRK